MSIPTYEELMKPLLEIVSDGQVYSMKELVNILADTCNLTVEEKNQLFLSDGQALFFNRVGWARTYLKRAGLINSPSCGFVQITERGGSVLDENLSQITNEFLMRFDEFTSFLEESRGFKRLPKDTELALELDVASHRKIPEEMLEMFYAELKDNVILQILKTVRSLTPLAFEYLVLDVLVRIGYGGLQKEPASVTERSGNEGIDGVIRQAPLGLDRIYVQAKQWIQPVGWPETQKFVGALGGKRAHKGIFITSSAFAKKADNYQEQSWTNIIFIDGKKLAELMFDYGVGLSTVHSYDIKRSDRDYFADMEGFIE